MMILDRRRMVTGAGSLILLGQNFRSGPVQAAGSAPAGAADGLVLDAQPGRLRLRDDGPETDILHFAGPEPLRILRVAQGQAFTVQIRNGLDEPTSLRWDGIRGRNGFDDPMARSPTAILPGTTRSVSLTPPDSGTYWFHPDPGSSDQTGRGLAGVLIVEEAAAPVVDHDVVCFLADWPLDAKNQIVKGAATSAPAPTTIVTVGARAIPSSLTFAPAARLRLRVVNGSTRRLMAVACDGAHPKIIAIDGQPSELFQPIRDTVPIGPGARFDYIIDLPNVAGQTVRLILKGTERIGETLEPDRLVATIATEGPALEARPPIAPLSANPALPPRIPLEASKRADLTFDRTDGETAAAWTVNGISGIALPAVPVLKVRRGASVTLGLINKSQSLVPLRVRGQAMRLLHTKDDGWEPYWRDSVLLPPESRHHVAFTAETAGQWLIESAFNDQNVAGLRCWFEVS